MGSNYSPLDEYVGVLRECYAKGYGPTTTAEFLEDNYDIETSRKSVSRAWERHNIVNTAQVAVENDEEDDFDEVPEIEPKMKMPKADPLWGTGLARLVAPATKEDTEIVLFLSDFHVPYHDKQLVDSAISVIEAMRPHRVVLNGDIVDLFQLSRFDKTRLRMQELQADLDEANEIRRRVREAAPNAVIDETEGNHDNRLISYVELNAPALQSLSSLKPEQLFKYKEYGINGHSGAGFLLRPEFLVRHGTVANQGAGTSAKAEFNNSGISGISGHTHRLATYRKSGYIHREWTEQGCLCRLDPDYVKGGAPDWQQGIVIGEFSNRSNSFRIHHLPAYEGRLSSTLFDRPMQLEWQEQKPRELRLVG